MKERQTPSSSVKQKRALVHVHVAETQSKAGTVCYGCSSTSRIIPLGYAEKKN